MCCWFVVYVLGFTFPGGLGNFCWFFLACVGFIVSCGSLSALVRRLRFVVPGFFHFRLSDHLIVSP